MGEGGGIKLSKSEIRAISVVRAVRSGERLAHVAKRMGIPFTAARRMLERHNAKDYKFQSHSPWASW